MFELLRSQPGMQIVVMTGPELSADEMALRCSTSSGRGCCIRPPSGAVEDGVEHARVRVDAGVPHATNDG